MGGICAKREEEPFFLPEDHPEVIARQEKWGLKKKKSVKDRRHTPANIGDEAKAVEDYREEMLKKMQDNMEVVSRHYMFPPSLLYRLTQKYRYRYKINLTTKIRKRLKAERTRSRA